MATKRPYGEGTFYFDETKQLYRAMLVSPSGKRLTKASKNEEIVKDWLNEQRLLVGRNQHVDPIGITLLEWATSWVDTYSRPNVRQRTYERNLSLLNHLEPIAGTALQKLTPTQIQSLYNDMADEGYASGTIKHVHKLLNGILKQAVANRYIMINPLQQGVKPPRIVRDEIEIFTAAEIELLLQLAQQNNPRLYPALLLAVTTGMRLGEVLGIRWQDIDLTNSTLQVRQSLQMTGIGIIFEPPKTEKGKRKIPLPQQMVLAFKEYRKLWSESKIKHAHNTCSKCNATGKLVDDGNKNIISYECPSCDHAWLYANDLVFVSNTHTPLHPKNFTVRFWHKLQTDAEFHMNEFKPEPLRTKEKYKVTLENCRMQADWQQFNLRNFHALRHTYATTLLTSGVPIVDVSRVLGHAKVSTTLDIYGHAIPENSKVIADKIANAFLK